MKDVILGIAGLAVVVLLAASVYQNQRRFHKPLLTTPYQSVTLQNGGVYFGRLDHLGTDYPVLRDAFTLRVETDGATGQPRYTVVRRKDEVTGADHMILPAASIAFVEPVAAGSVADKAIRQANIR